VVVLTFVKFGGSLITDKRREQAYRQSVVERLASEIAVARSAKPDLQLLLGHGSGSFGHVAARRFGTRDGVHTPEQWRGFAHVATVASELSQRVATTLDNAGVPVWRLQPSASARSEDGRLISMALEPIHAALAHGLIPLVHGDVSLDTVRGGTIISTETIFFYLAQELPVSRILLLGEVEGVYDTAQTVIPQITPGNLSAVETALGGAEGTDVTGGMEAKVRAMVALVERLPQLTIRIFDGRQPGLLTETLLERATPGTLIHAGQ